MNRFIRLDEKNIIVSIRIASSIVDGEIESTLGELGQRMLPDGTFEDVVEDVPTEL